jgi:hypothetical protein
MNQMPDTRHFLGTFDKGWASKIYKTGHNLLAEKEDREFSSQLALSGLKCPGTKLLKRLPQKTTLENIVGKPCRIIKV